MGFRADSREPVPVSTERPLKVNIALILAAPESTTTQQARAGARPAGNVATLPGGGRNRSGGGLGDYSGSGNGNGADASLRISEGAGAEATASPEPSAPEETDTSASAANSFLMGGGVGEAATPGEGRFGGRGTQLRNQ